MSTLRVETGRILRGTGFAQIKGGALYRFRCSPSGADSLKVARRGYNFLGEVRCKFLKVAKTAICLEIGCGANF